MKWRLSIIIAVLIVTLSAKIALADSPQPVQYAMMHCSGLSIDLIMSSERQFDDAYGFNHQLTTPAAWNNTYVARVNEFARTVGCPQMLNDDGSSVGSLTFAAKIYAPVYRVIVTHGVFPE